MLAGCVHWFVYIDSNDEIACYSNFLVSSMMCDQCMLSFLVRTLSHWKYAWVRFQFHRGLVITALSASRRYRCNDRDKDRCLSFLAALSLKVYLHWRALFCYALRLRWKIDSRAGGKLFTEEDDLLFYLIFRLWLVESTFNIIFSKHGLLTFSEFLMGAYSRRSRLIWKRYFLHRGFIWNDILLRIDSGYLINENDKQETENVLFSYVNWGSRKLKAYVRLSPLREG